MQLFIHNAFLNSVASRRMMRWKGFAREEGLAQNVDLNIQSITGNAVLNCAVEEVLRWTSPVTPTRSRSFVQLN
jgi:hypothetical protein